MFPVLLLFILGFILGVFYIFSLARRDLVLVRHSIGEEAIIDLVIASFFFGFLGARILHVAIYFENFGFDIFRWILFPYFPGLSLMGGVLGALGFILIFCRKRKLPIRTILDIAVLGFLLASPFGFLGAFPIYIIEGILFFLLFLIFTIFRKMRIIRRDGIVALTFFCIFAIVTFAFDFVRFDRKYIAFLTVNQWISIVLAATSITFLVRFKKEEISRFLRKNNLIW